MNTARSKLLWVTVAIGAAVAGFWFARYQLHSSAVQLASGTWLPRARELKPFTLTDESGRALTLASLVGHPWLVFFGFTHCPDVCPTTLATLAQARKSSGVKNLRVLLVSVDPARDRPALLAQYVHAFDPSFAGATGSQQAIDAVTHDFGVAVQRVDLPGGDYTMDHSAAVFLLNAGAKVAAIFTPPFEAKALGGDLRAVAQLVETP